MTSPVDLCNLALAHLGEAPISSLDDDTAAGRACAGLYAAIRDEVLRAHRWNFASARVVLAELPGPVFGWEHAFELPTDCLRVLEVNDTEEGASSSWVIEGRAILARAGVCRLVYIRRIEDVTLFDSIFAQALGLKLAVGLAESIRGTTSKTVELTERYERITAPLARRIDANESRRRKGLLPLNSQAIRARHGV